MIASFFQCAKHLEVNNYMFLLFVVVVLVIFFFKLASHRMTCHMSSQNIGLYTSDYSLLPGGSFCHVTQNENRKGSNDF